MPSSLEMRSSRTSRIAWLALGLGLLGDLLLRETPWGMNATVWLSLLALAALATAGRQDESEAPRWLLLLAIASAAGLAWRSSPVLLTLFSVLYLMSISLRLLRDPWKAGVLYYALAPVVALAQAAFFALGALLDLARGRRPVEGRLRAHTPLLRGALVATPFLLAFGALFSAADPVFEWYVGDIFGFLLERLPSHLLMVLFLAWVACGSLYGLAIVHIPELFGRGAHHDGASGSRGTEAVVALLLVNTLFLVFLLVQLRTLFGGQEFLEATLGLSYAAYAREGFFQLVTASAIALPGLLVADWFVPAGSTFRSRVRILAGALLVMMTAVLVSAALRMRLYVDAYGLTELRLYTSAFMVWLGVVFAWFSVTVLRNRRERFMAGATGIFMAGVFLLSALNPDATIVRANAARIADWEDGFSEMGSRTAFDARYAASLSADAVPLLLEVIPRLDPWQRCVVAEGLLAHLEGEESPNWRSWNLSRWRARKSIHRARPGLERTFRACPVTIQAPGHVTAKGDFIVRWSHFMTPTDHVSIARPGAAVGAQVSSTATWHQPLELKAPSVPGTYEIRYHLGRSRRIVGRHPLVVVPIQEREPDARRS